jgi:hypothetical protein
MGASSLNLTTNFRGISVMILLLSLLRKKTEEEEIGEREQDK